ncbi:hypothetical protein M9Y10_010630 [Tritrichomonas musculus]|uniref:DUF3447 domain-containing protein n=1 Tax=Tritrichomonas musculus TaxID=1915356 RepID=A0ABR2ILE6_9EUKA
MSLEEFLSEMQQIQENLLDYIDDESTAEGKFQFLKNIFDKIKIHDNPSKIKQILSLIFKISNNHHYKEDFFNKIERILYLFIEDMKKYFSNEDILRIFKNNKRILLFLLEEKIMIGDESFGKFITRKKLFDAKYPEYFSPEIEPFINFYWFSHDGMARINILVEKWTKDQLFYEKRKKSQNDNFVCQLIQKDLIDDFIVYVNKTNYSLQSTIEPSIYETNSFLLDQKNISLIEYAVFYGSIQIIFYLIHNNVELTPSLWKYAIHGKNADIIHLLESNKIKPPEDPNNQNNNIYEQIFIDSIKCHHNDIANYIKNNYLYNNQKYSKEILQNIFKYYNYLFIQNDMINSDSLHFLIKYDHCDFVSFLLKQKDIDVNMKIMI